MVSSEFKLTPLLFADNMEQQRNFLRLFLQDCYMQWSPRYQIMIWNGTPFHYV